MAPVQQPVDAGRGAARSEAAAPTGQGMAFRSACQVVLDYLNSSMPMAFWSITRVENDRQTYLYLEENDYGLAVGGSHPWHASFCVHMVAGTAPRIAPDTSTVPSYVAAPVSQALTIGAYAGAPIDEPDGTLFGAICGLDRKTRLDLVSFEPTLNALSKLLSLALGSDRALKRAEQASETALDYASTDSLTGIRNRRAWDDAIHKLELDFETYADPTAIVVIDLDNLKEVNDGPGGHAAGDELLRDAVGVMRRAIRSGDFLARLGGDEFGIILTKCPASLVPQLAERLTRSLDLAAVPASVGWSALRPDETVHHAFQLADRAMYAAKQGRRLVGSP